jgi:hypothetical protein
MRHALARGTRAALFLGAKGRGSQRRFSELRRGHPPAKKRPHPCVKQNRKDGAPRRYHRIEGRPPARVAFGLGIARTTANFPFAVLWSPLIFAKARPSTRAARVALTAGYFAASWASIDCASGIAWPGPTRIGGAGRGGTDGALIAERTMGGRTVIGGLLATSVAKFKFMWSGVRPRA